MGSSNSVEAANEEADNVMLMIDRKCNSYVMSVEHTNSVVDITLDGLRKEIFALIEPLRSSKHFVDLGMEDMSEVLQLVEHHGNTQKFAIQRMLDIMFEAQTTFEEMCDSTMANADVDDLPEVLLDEGCMTRIRHVIENLLIAYETELKSKDVCFEMAQQRCAELHRLLFKLAEVVVSDMVDSTVSEMKDAFLEDIDNMICLSMMSGEFKYALAAKECLQNIISKSIVARVSLEALPFSRRVEVEAGQDEIEQFVDDLVRKVQMHHSNEETQHFEQLMNLNMEYSDSDGDDDDDGDSGSVNASDDDNASANGSSSSSDDNSTEPEDTEDDEQSAKKKVVLKKTPPSKKRTSSKSPVSKTPPSKTPASKKKTPVQATEKSVSVSRRKRKEAVGEDDDEVTVTTRRATRARR